MNTQVKEKEYNVYIDESGDEGIRRGSKFFILTAVLVKKEKDYSISKCVDFIKENLELNIKSQLHWNSVKGYPNKIMIMSSIKDMDITIINIVIDTSKIQFINSNDIYNHFSGYLYETVFAKEMRYKNLERINPNEYERLYKINMNSAKKRYDYYINISKKEVSEN